MAHKELSCTTRSPNSAAALSRWMFQLLVLHELALDHESGMARGTNELLFENVDTLDVDRNVVAALGAEDAIEPATLESVLAIRDRHVGHHVRNVLVDVSAELLVRRVLANVARAPATLGGLGFARYRCLRWSCTVQCNRQYSAPTLASRKARTARTYIVRLFVSPLVEVARGLLRPNRRAAPRRGPCESEPRAYGALGKSCHIGCTRTASGDFGSARPAPRRSRSECSTASTCATGTPKHRSGFSRVVAPHALVRCGDTSHERCRIRGRIGPIGKRND